MRRTARRPTLKTQRPPRVIKRLAKLPIPLSQTENLPRAHPDVGRGLPRDSPRWGKGRSCRRSLPAQATRRKNSSQEER